MHHKCLAIALPGIHTLFFHGRGKLQIVQENVSTRKSNHSDCGEEKVDSLREEGGDQFKSNFLSKSDFKEIFQAALGTSL